MSLLFPEKVPDPSIEEQTSSLREANTQQLLAKQKQIMLINRPDAITHPEEADQLDPFETKMKGTPELPNAMETRMSMSPASQYISGTDIINFLFGDEMGVLGMKMDAEGIQWEWDIAKDQWANNPLWVNLLASTSLVGSALFPAAQAARSTYKFGMLGAALGKFGDKAGEIKKFKELKQIDEATKIEDVSEATLKTLRMQEVQNASHNRLSALLEAEGRGELEISGWEKAKFEFQKRFANTYFQLGTGLVANSGARAAYHSSLDELWKAEDIGKVLADVPEADAKVYQHWLHMEDATLVPDPKLDPKTRAWADDLSDRMRKHQQEAVDEALITEETRKHIGSMHIPAQTKGTPLPDVDIARTHLVPIRGRKVTERPGVLVGKDVPREGKLKRKLLGETKHIVEEEGRQKYLSVSTYKTPRLDYDTLVKERKADLPEIAQRLQNGELITDPAELTFRGYMMDRMILNNFRVMRDMAMNDSWATSHSDIISEFGGEGITISKMTEAANKAGFVSLDTIPEGARAALTRMIRKKGGQLGPDGQLPWMRKSAFDELFSESGAFNQAQAASDMMEVLTTMFKTSKTALSVPTHFQNGVGNLVMMAQAGMNPFEPKNLDILIGSSVAFRKIADYHTAARKAGISSREILDSARVDLGTITVNGKKFNLTEELFDPVIRDLIEESSFTKAEGAGHLEDLLKSLRSEQRLTRGAIKAYMKGKELLQVGDRFKWADGATKAYLAEDMIPKMGMYLKLRGDGLTKAAAAIEVGRRLPMYSTVGSAVRQGRRWAFPWATFPLEAMRITKNNLMDHPLRMIPWLQATNIMQAAFSATGAAPTSPEDVKATRRGLPMWAQQSSTVVGSGGAVAGVGGAMTGGLTGAAVGGKFGGARGAMLGAAIGGAAGAAGLRAATTEEDTETMRGMVMDWLPHSSFMLASNSPDMMSDYAPFRGLSGALTQLPTEPLAIFRPMIDIMMGRTGFGTELPSAGPGHSFGQMLAGYIGFLSPPLIQKYGFKTNTPDIAASEAILGRALPGDITNVSRLLQDTGSAIDPNTGKPGSLTHDFLLKNLGIGKSWSAHGSVALANETETERAMAKVRNYLSRQLSHYAANGDQDKLMKVLTDVMETYTKQYASEPGKATEEYRKWVEGKLGSLGTFPRLRNWSKDEMVHRMARSFEHARDSRSYARSMIQDTIKKQMAIKSL